MACAWGHVGSVVASRSPQVRLATTWRRIAGLIFSGALFCGVASRNAGGMRPGRAANRGCRDTLWSLHATLVLREAESAGVTRMKTSDERAVDDAAETSAADRSSLSCLFADLVSAPRSTWFARVVDARSSHQDRNRPYVARLFLLVSLIIASAAVGFPWFGWLFFIPGALQVALEIYLEPIMRHRYEAVALRSSTGRDGRRKWYCPVGHRHRAGTHVGRRLRHSGLRAGTQRARLACHPSCARCRPRRSRRLCHHDPRLRHGGAAGNQVGHRRRGQHE